MGGKTMKKLFPELTDKMQMLYMDIIASLGQLPLEQRGFIFGFDGEEDYDWIHAVACYIILEFIKYSYDYADPEYSLRHFLKNNDDDSERMLQSRTMQYVLRHKKREIEIKGGSISREHKFANIEMDTIDKKLKGHRLTEMNFFENQIIHDLELIKSIVERRIVSSKKVSNKHFQEIFEQYDEFVECLIERSKRSDEDMVFASLALFTFEWHYPIETFYELACIMEEEGLDTVDQDSLILTCGFVDLESSFGGWYTTDSRMVKERLLILPYLFGKKTDDIRRRTMKELIKEILVLVVQYTELMGADDGGTYKDWFRKESSMEDWASFFRFYDIFAIWQRKEWTRTRIQNVRYLFNLTLTPKN